jgi:hypothetical protein
VAPIPLIQPEERMDARRLEVDIDQSDTPALLDHAAR